MSLRTDFKDDIFEGNRRYRITDNGDGTKTITDVTEYTQTGDMFGAKELNEITTEVNETKKSVSDGKGLIAAAITEKKIAAEATDTFAQLADKIGQIICGSGTAIASDVRQGKTFTNDQGVETEGTMPEKAAATYTPGTSNQTIAAGQYLAGPQTIKGDANLKGANIIKGKSIFGVAGTLAVQSAINFSAAAIAHNVVRISWTNPAKGPWQGVQIRMSTSGYPGVSGGAIVYTGAGSSSVAGATSYYDITGLDENIQYYFTCCSYVTNIGNGSSHNVSAKTGIHPGTLYAFGYNRGLVLEDDEGYATFNTNHIYVDNNYCWLRYNGDVDLPSYYTVNASFILYSVEYLRLNVRLRNNSDSFVLADIAHELENGELSSSNDDNRIDLSFGPDDGDVLHDSKDGVLFQIYTNDPEHNYSYFHFTGKILYLGVCE